jgi:hypothetical protein
LDIRLAVAAKIAFVDLDLAFDKGAFFSRRAATRQSWPVCQPQKIPY